MALFEGRFHHEVSKNFEEFLKAIGVPLVPRKVVAACNPTVEIRREGDRWRIRMNHLLRDVVYCFTPGEMVLSEGMGGMAENVFSVEEDCIRQHQTSATYSTEIIREFTQDRLIMTLTHKESGTVCYRYFNRV